MVHVIMRRVAVTKWESGMTENLKLVNLLGLCELFGVSVEELVRGTSSAKAETARQSVSEQAAIESAWRAYSAASGATRAVVDLVLLPKSERDALERQVLLSIEILEERAIRLLNQWEKAKSA